MTTTPTTKPTPAEVAAQFLMAATQHGYSVEAHRSGDQYVVTVAASFTPGDRDAYVRCDGSGCSVLAILPMTKPGSIWGTDGGSVGGHAGMTGGYYHLSKSGVGVKVGQAIEKGR
jgi:hypothetical protein